MKDETREAEAKTTPRVLPGSVTHRILAVASATPRHWFELDELANRRGMRLCDKGAITTALKMLANHGFLERHQGQQDGNVQLYTLTRAGEQVLDELYL